MVVGDGHVRMVGAQVGQTVVEGGDPLQTAGRPDRLQIHPVVGRQELGHARLHLGHQMHLMAQGDELVA